MQNYETEHFFAKNDKNAFEWKKKMYCQQNEKKKQKKERSISFYPFLCVIISNSFGAT